MYTWIRRFRFLFSAPRPTPQAASVLLAPPAEQTVNLRSSAPPITDLDLLRALGCDV